jgi:hypothetical protein
MTIPTIAAIAMKIPIIRRTTTMMEEPLDDGVEVPPDPPPTVACAVGLVATVAVAVAVASIVKVALACRTAGLLPSASAKALIMTVPVAGPWTVQDTLKLPLLSTTPLTGRVIGGWPPPPPEPLSVSETDAPVESPTKLLPCMVSGWPIWTDSVERLRAGGDDDST